MDAAHQSPGEARFADARLAGDDRHAPVLPRVLDGAPLTIAADEPRRTQHCDGPHCMSLPVQRDDRRRTAVFNHARQLERLLARLCIQLTIQHIGAALERGQRAGAIAAQIVQPHHAPVRMFEQRIVGDQALGVAQRVCDVALRFEARRDLGQRIAARDRPLLARHRDPIGEIDAVVEGQARRAARRLRLPDRR